MKELVIKVVSFFSWLGIITFVLFGYGWGVSANHQILGPIAGFLIGCCVSGLWFLLVSMHEKLAIIAAALVISTQAHAFQESMDPSVTLPADSILEDLRFNGKEEDGTNYYTSGFLKGRLFILPDVAGIKEGEFLKKYIPSAESQTLHRRVYGKSINCHFQEVMENGVNQFRVYACDLIDNNFTKDIAP